MGPGVASQDDPPTLTAESSRPPSPVPSPGCLGGALRNASDLRRVSPEPAAPSPSAADRPPSFAASMACLVWVYFAQSQKRTDAGRVWASVGRTRGPCVRQGLSSSRLRPSAGGAVPAPSPPRRHGPTGVRTLPGSPAVWGPGCPRDFPDLPPCRPAGSDVCGTHGAVRRAPSAPRPHRVTLRVTAVSGRRG